MLLLNYRFERRKNMTLNDAVETRKAEWKKFVYNCITVTTVIVIIIIIIIDITVCKYHTLTNIEASHDTGKKNAVIILYIALFSSLLFHF